MNHNGFNEKNDSTLDALDEKMIKAVRKAAAIRRKKRAVTVLSVAVLAFLSAGIFAVFSLIGNVFSTNTLADLPDDNGSSQVFFSDSSDIIVNQEMRGVWIASVININFPSKPGLSEKQLKAELEDIVKNAYEAGLNAIFFQVRPTADALYPSELFPYSKYLTGAQGVAPENSFDCLEYLINIASEKEIDVHAWVNPYRVTMYESDMEGLCKSSPAALHPEYTVKYADGKTYFNPGLPEVRTLIIDGVKELAINYPELAGIHFDDYFYPYPSGNAEFDDAAAYELYGNGMSLADWRRENVNTLVRDTYKAIKEINEEISFGVSPFGIWANAGSGTPVDGSTSSGLEAYTSLYCDALAWANGGYVDYLVPQIYWSFSSSAAPFDNIARWWNTQLDGTGVDFYIGHAAYKTSEFPKNEIGIQVEFARNLLSYRGSVYYGYADIKNNTNGLKDKIAQLNKTPIEFSYTGSGSAKINQPVNNYNSTAPTVTVVGESDVSTPLTVNGKKVSRTKSGYFSYYDTITTGINVFTLEQSGKKNTHNINYKNTRASGNSTQTLPGLTVSDIIPATEAWIMEGDTLSVSCVAPAGSKVTAKIGGMSFELKPTLNKINPIKYAKEIYMGEITPSSFVSQGEIADLGTLTITATLDGKTVTQKGGLIRQMGKNALVYAEVINDYSHLKISTTSSFYDDYTPASIGMRDYVTGLAGSFYKLKFGGYISADNVKIVNGIQLNKNKLLSVKVLVNGKDTKNNKNNFTDVVFECLENSPVNAVASAGKITVTFYNTDSDIIPKPEISPNPLISMVTAHINNEGNLVYELILKNELNVYGYNVVYENGNIIIRMNNPQTLSDNPEKPLKDKTIVVDAGHGGTDSGALGISKKNEAMLNFEISLHLQKELENLGATVLMTRTGDNQTVSLEERMEFLNDANPDLAISVHQNSIASSTNAQKVRGYLGLYSTEAGKFLAKTVSSVVCDRLNRYERPYAYQMLAVARNHRFPSTLCEMCFISNVEEYEWSVTPGNTLRSAQAIAEGVLEYYRAQEVYLAY